MAKIPDKVNNIITKYLLALNNNNINVNKAILFGSFARGNYNTESDIDVAIVSDSFEGNRIKDRSKIRAITLSISSNIEVIPLSLKDFNEKDPFVEEIINTGVDILQ